MGEIVKVKGRLSGIPQLKEKLMGTNQVQDLIGRIVRAMVDQPDEVHIGTQEKPSCTVIQIRVADDDVRKVVGRKGQNLQAIRQIVQAMTVRSKNSSGRLREKRFAVDFDDPRNRSRQHFSECFAKTC